MFQFGERARGETQMFFPVKNFYDQSWYHQKRNSLKGSTLEPIYTWNIPCMGWWFNVQQGYHGDGTGAKWEPPSCRENSCSKINKPPSPINLSPQDVTLASSCGLCQTILSWIFAIAHLCAILKMFSEKTVRFSSPLSVPPSLPSFLPTGRPNLNEAQQLKRLIIQINIWTHPFFLSHSNIHITVAKEGELAVIANVWVCKSRWLFFFPLQIRPCDKKSWLKY